MNLKADLCLPHETDAFCRSIWSVFVQIAQMFDLVRQYSLYILLSSYNSAALMSFSFRELLLHSRYLALKVRQSGFRIICRILCLFWCVTLSRMFCLQNSVCRLSYWKSRYKVSAAAYDTSLVFKGAPLLLRLILLSGRNCLLCRLLRLSESGSEMRVSAPPDTLSRCYWKLYETRLSQKHIPHKSSRPISRDICSDESWS